MTTRAALVWIILGTGLACCSTLAKAQTYYPNYPVCLQVYVPGNYISCTYTSIAQCNATASGLGATCYANPYFAPSPWPAWRRRAAGFGYR
jgi:hypothetical protein